MLFSPFILISEPQVIFADTTQIGLYRVDLGDARTTYFAVNLFSPQESSMLTKTALQVSGLSPSAFTASQEQARREYWRPIALLALLLLFIEWLVYQRTALVMLWQQASGVFSRKKAVKR